MLKNGGGIVLWIIMYNLAADTKEESTDLTINC